MTWGGVNTISEPRDRTICICDGDIATVSAITGRVAIEPTVICTTNSRQYVYPPAIIGSSVHAMDCRPSLPNAQGGHGMGCMSPSYAMLQIHCVIGALSIRWPNDKRPWNSPSMHSVEIFGSRPRDPVNTFSVVLLTACCRHLSSPRNSTQRRIMPCFEQ